MSSELAAQQLLRVEAPRHHAALWRNNSGAVLDPETGRMIRFGLANDSAKLNKHFKSSDLIGIQTVTITPDMVGRTIGVFLAVEVKHPGWHMTPGDKRAKAQANFGQMVTQMGGIFRFATRVDDVWPLR